MSGLNPITIILIVNSLSVVSLVLTQNDTTKEELSKKSSSSNRIFYSLVLEVRRCHRRTRRAR